MVRIFFLPYLGNRSKSDPCSYEPFCLESHIISFLKVLQIPPESPCICTQRIPNSIDKSLSLGLHIYIYIYIYIYIHTHTHTQGNAIPFAGNLLSLFSELCVFPLLYKHMKITIRNYNFVCCFVWVSNLVHHADFSGTLC